MGWLMLAGARGSETCLGGFFAHLGFPGAVKLLDGFLSTDLLGS